VDELEFKKVKDELDSVVKTIDKKLEEYASDYKKASQGAKEDIKKELEPLLKSHSDLQDTIKKMQGQLDDVDVKIQRVGPSKIQKPTFDEMARLNFANIAKNN
jgi:FtsZ-binding cell division protein ZapB